MYYSQCEEDRFLNDHYFKNKRNGFYIELGALDGVKYSNTKFFEDQLGWTGILIEPNSFPFELLRQNRPNNYLFNHLVSCIEEEVQFKYFIHPDAYAAVSGIENTLPKEHFTNFFKEFECNHLPNGCVLMKPVSLTSIVKSTDIPHFDLLSLDVEGHEYEVLLSWDFSIPIDVIMFETLGGSQSEKEEQCRELLIKNGYKFDAKFKHNEIFVMNNLSLDA